jgi:mersacidin/lichenicidin family type 2 lantibiotic
MMDIIRAWKDEKYRLSLTEEQRALLPDNPPRPLELSDADLERIVGGQQVPPHVFHGAYQRFLAFLSSFESRV